MSLRAFHLHREEVTAGQYALCVRAGGCREAEVETGGGYFTYGDGRRLSHPVNGVTWAGARDYCAWIGGRLPTEAEWEYAARGSDGRRHPWGNQPASCDRANMRTHLGRGCGNDGVIPVNHQPLTGFDQFYLLHMGGNVWEWVADWYDERAYAHAPAGNPTGPASGTRRVQRGGGRTNDDPVELRAAYRAAMEPGSKLNDLGFRCALDRLAGR